MLFLFNWLPWDIFAQTFATTSNQSINYGGIIVLSNDQFEINVEASPIVIAGETIITQINGAIHKPNCPNFSRQIFIILYFHLNGAIHKPNCPGSDSQLFLAISSSFYIFQFTSPINNCPSPTFQLFFSHNLTFCNLLTIKGLETTSCIHFGQWPQPSGFGFW